MKKIMITMGLIITLLFALDITTQVSSMNSTFGIKFVETAYAQDKATPAAEAPKAEAPAATASDAEAPKAEKPVPELPGSKDDPATDLDTETFLKAAMVALGSWKALGSMGLAALIAQLLMLFLRTPLASFAGKYKMVAVYLLSVVSGLLTLKVTGMDWGAAALHSQTLVAFQAWIHQIYKQFIVKANEKPA